MAAASVEVREVKGSGDRLSNMFKCRFWYDDVLFNSVEQAYQYHKALFLQRPDVADGILRERNGKHSKSFANIYLRSLAQSNQEWNAHRISLMRWLLDARAKVDHKFVVELFLTGSAAITHPVGEGFWGVNNFGVGENQFSNLLMDLRSKVGAVLKMQGPHICLDWLHDREHKKSKCELDHFLGVVFDTHCHLDRLEIFTNLELKDLPLPNQFFAGCITNIIDPARYNRWTELAELPGVRFTAGLHPSHANELQAFQKFVSEEGVLERCVAIGECGLDGPSTINHVSLEAQISAFIYQIELALQESKAIVVHCRDYSKMARDIMVQHIPLDKRDWRIHLHCFTAGLEEALKWKSLFSAIKFGVTNAVYSNANVQKIAQYLPMDDLLVETDSPYFPSPNIEGETVIGFSHPGNALSVYAKIALLRPISVRKAAACLNYTAKTMYNITF